MLVFSLPPPQRFFYTLCVRVVPVFGLVWSVCIAWSTIRTIRTCPGGESGTHTKPHHQSKREGERKTDRIPIDDATRQTTDTH